MFFFFLFVSVTPQGKRMDIGRPSSPRVQPRDYRSLGSESGDPPKATRK